MTVQQEERARCAFAGRYANQPGTSAQWLHFPALDSYLVSSGCDMEERVARLLDSGAQHSASCSFPKPCSCPEPSFLHLLWLSLPAIPRPC
jgi:hypothetical protein